MSVLSGGRTLTARRHTMQRLTAPPALQLQGHPVPLYADLHGSLWAARFLLVGDAALELLQLAEAFLIAALQRTNHSSVHRLTSRLPTLDPLVILTGFSPPTSTSTTHT